MDGNIIKPLTKAKQMRRQAVQECYIQVVCNSVLHRDATVRRLHRDATVRLSIETPLCARASMRLRE